MDSSRASSSIQLIQLPNTHHQDAEQHIQSNPHPIVAGGPFIAPIEEQLPPQADFGPAPESSVKAWLSVAGAFCYLFPTYGKQEHMNNLLSPAPLMS